MDICIVNYKETMVDDFNVMHTECGTCDEAFTDEAEAIKLVATLADGKYGELGNEHPDGEISRSSSPNGDYQSVTHGGDTYEYYTYFVRVNN